MQTKEFISFFGNPKPLTKREYQKRWVEITNQMFNMFSDAEMMDEWISMQKNIEKAAGVAWDNHE